MRVLIVEDDKKVAGVVRRGLEAEGFAVDVALTGTDGLWMASENPYDVIVLDIMLPGMNGFKVCEQLRDARQLDADPDADREGRRVRPRRGARHRRRRLPDQAVLVRRAAARAFARCSAAAADTPGRRTRPATSRINPVDPPVLPRRREIDVDRPRVLGAGVPDAPRRRGRLEVGDPRQRVGLRVRRRSEHRRGLHPPPPASKIDEPFGRHADRDHPRRGLPPRPRAVADGAPARRPSGSASRWRRSLVVGIALAVGGVLAGPRAAALADPQRRDRGPRSARATSPAAIADGDFPAVLAVPTGDENLVQVVDGTGAGRRGVGEPRRRPPHQHAAPGPERVRAPERGRDRRRRRPVPASSTPARRQTTGAYTVYVARQPRAGRRQHRRASNGLLLIGVPAPAPARGRDHLGGDRPRAATGRGDPARGGGDRRRGPAPPRARARRPTTRSAGSRRR